MLGGIPSHYSIVDIALGAALMQFWQQAGPVRTPGQYLSGLVNVGGTATSAGLQAVDMVLGVVLVNVVKRMLFRR